MPHRIVIPGPAWPQYEFWTARERWPRPKSFIYVIRARGSSPIKIGKAVDVRGRMAELQTGNPAPLELFSVLVGDLAFESALHRIVPLRKRTGEWFDGSEEEVTDFISWANELAVEMYTAYRETKRLPDFEDFSPFKEQREARGVSVTAEELNRVGRLSSARREPAIYAWDQVRRTKEEFAWIQDGEPT